MRHLLVLAVLASAARADEVPRKYRPAVEKGLVWLAKQQHPDGHFSAASDQYPTSMTALAGLTLVAEGSTPSQGKYAEALRRAVAFLLDRSRKGGAMDGLLGNPDSPGEAGRYLFGHGYAMLFLATVVDDLEPKTRRQAKDVLNRAVQFSARAQTTRGGWGYVSAKDGGNFDEGASCMVQIHGIRAAQLAGIPGTQAVLKNAFKYANDSTDAQGGVVYSLASGGGSGRPPLTAAALAVGAAPDASAPIAKIWHLYCSKMIPLTPPARFGYDEFAHYYYAQAVYALGEEGWAKLFPQRKKEERVLWSKYRALVFDQLIQKQQADGSWTSGSAGVGPVYATAVNLTILQLDKGHLPIQRH